MKRFPKHIVFFLLLWPGLLAAQNQWGIISSNFAGIQSIWINPANIVNQPYDYDFNLISFSGGLSNNAFYYDRANLPQRALNNDLNFQIGSHDTLLTTDGKKKYPIRKDITENNYAFGELNIMGPALLVNKRDRAWAVSLSQRNFMSVVNAGRLAAHTFYDGLGVTRFWNEKVILEDLNIAFLSWYEGSYTQARVLRENRHYMFKAGASGKLLLGIGAGFFADHGTDAYYRPDSTFQITRSNFTLVRAIGDGKSISPMSDLGSPKGFGLGFDVGVVFLRKDKTVRKRGICPNLYGEYEFYTKNKWRFGASLLDWGIIYFGSNAKRTDFVNDSITWRRMDTIFTPNLLRVERAFLTVFENQPQAMVSSSDYFFAILPSCISFQFDAKVYSNIYVNASWIQRVSVGAVTHVRRMNTIALTPRIESDWFELAFPMRLIEYRSFVSGAAIKFHFLYFGSDRILEILGYTERILGGDFYAGIKLPLHRKIGKGGMEY